MSGHQKALIGDVKHDFWLYDSRTGFDLTRPANLIEKPGVDAITISTTSLPVTIDPAKSALVIIDMQNFFLSEALGRPRGSKGLVAQEQLLEHAIPAARKASIQVAWLNWNLSEEDLEEMHPATLRAFGFNSMPADKFDELYASNRPQTDGVSIHERLNHNPGHDSRIYKGMGHDLGQLTLPDGTNVSAGRQLMKGQWNTEMSRPLHDSYKASLDSSKPDVIIDKNRISGMHLPNRPAQDYFGKHGIKTLIFTGVNTDQCVLGTMTDAYCQGYDVIMLKDGCATTSLSGAQQSVEDNTAKIMGFVTTCELFSQGIDEALRQRSKA